MAKAKRKQGETLVCVPCGYGVTISDLGSAVVECYECGVELQPKTAVPRKALPAKAAAKKTAARKPAGKKPAAKKK